MGLRTWLHEKTGIKLKQFNNETNNDVWKYSRGNVSKMRASVIPQADMPSAPEGSISGFVGRDLQNNRAAQNTFLKLVPEKQERNYLVVCFYTADNEYAEIVKNLQASLEKFSIPHKLVPIASEGAWELNCAVKAKFIQQEWELSNVPIVWIDADATVEEDPVLFSQLDCDIAFHKWEGWEASSGTIYLAKSDLTKQLIDQWVLRCEADPVTWDQVSLHSAWCDISSVAPLRTAWLPPEYYAIFDAQGISRPVIKHWQASRQAKTEGHNTGKPPLQFTEEGMRKRYENELWRTPEEAFWILEGTRHIKPETGKEYPEGFDVEPWLRAAIGDCYPLLEVGCGVGRIAKLFKPEEYIGVDVNPNAVIQARKSSPSHYIRLVDDGMAYPQAASLLFYTVLLHVADDVILDVLKRACDSSDTIIISELMDRRWRRDGNPPVFNRDAEDYILMMQNLGYTLTYADKKAYDRYDVEPWNIGRDSRITTLVFKRRSETN